MTRQSTFKKQIRARMAKTGERYAAARMALLRRAALGGDLPAGYPTGAPMLTDLGPLSAALAQAGVVDPGTGAPFTEARLFGLSGGPGFMVFLFQYAGLPPMLTLTCRSFSLPGPVIDRALEHAGVAVERVETGSARKAAAALDAVLDEGRVAHVAVDQARLPWLGLDPRWRGQWPRHVNVVARRPGGWLVHDQGLFALGDAELAEARAGVKKAKHRLLAIRGPGAGDPVAATRRALSFFAHNQRHAPYSSFANNFGLAGLARLARDMADAGTQKGWARIFDTGPLAFRALWRTWECVNLELTAPAGGRPLFAEFLEEAADQLGSPDLVEAAALARESGSVFEALADRALAAGGDRLAQAVALSEDIDEALRSGAADAGQRVRALREARTALADEAELSAEARREAFDGLADDVTRIAAIEERLVEAVERAMSG